jgi:hypothetical protein
MLKVEKIILETPKRGAAISKPASGYNAKLTIEFNIGQNDDPESLSECIRKAIEIMEADST